MAIRPIYIPELSKVGVREIQIEFEWYPGFSLSQKRKCISELHRSAKNNGFKHILEISSKSDEPLGVALSAFNLLVNGPEKINNYTVETAFQSSKVFSNGGPYRDLLGLDSLGAKRDIRLKESGELVKFDYLGTSFSLNPTRFFYSWIYINAINNNKFLTNEILSYDGFSDIEFNPKKSINSQSYSAALYLSLVSNGLLNDSLRSPDSFINIIK